MHDWRLFLCCSKQKSFKLSIMHYRLSWYLAKECMRVKLANCNISLLNPQNVRCLVNFVSYVPGYEFDTCCVGRWYQMHHEFEQMFRIWSFTLSWMVSITCWLILVWKGWWRATQTHTHIKICQLKDLILTLHGLIFRRV